MDLLKRTFETKFVHDVYRTYHGGDNDGDDENENAYFESLPSFSVPLTSVKLWIEPPDVWFSIQVVWILFLQMVMGAMLAVVIYYGILPPTMATRTEAPSSSPGRHRTTEQRPQRQGGGRLSPPGQPASLSATLLAYGVVIPVALAAPLVIVDRCDIRNIGLRLAWVSMPLTVTLRCLEALYGFVPTPRRRSLAEYVMYVGFILQPRYTNINSTNDGDDEDGTKVSKSSSSQQRSTIPMTHRVAFRILIQNYIWVAAYTVLYHCMKPSDFSPFSSPGDGPGASHSLVHWDLPHMYDTLAQACLLSVTLALSMTGVSALGGLLTGAQMDDRVTRLPLFLSESVGDFWGRRWNNLIHVALKQGVYKPVRSAMGGDRRTLASVAVFCVSGLYHEYVWVLMFFATQAQRREAGDGGDSGAGPDASSACCPSCYCDAWVGKQLIFFGWNGALIAMEHAFGRHLSKLAARLPRLLRSHLIVLLSLPVGHLFTADLVRAGYFDHIRPAIPVIVRIEYNRNNG